jgi:hypothetical protein
MTRTAGAGLSQPHCRVLPRMDSAAWVGLVWADFATAAQPMRENDCEPALTVGLRIRIAHPKGPRCSP